MDVDYLKQKALDYEFNKSSDIKEEIGDIYKNASESDKSKIMKVLGNGALRSDLIKDGTSSEFYLGNRRFGGRRSRRRRTGRKRRRTGRRRR